MRNIYFMPGFDLQLFSDGAAAGAAGPAGNGGAPAAQQDGTGTLPKAEANRGRGSSRRARTGAFDNVVFGKQDAAAEAAVTTDPAAGGQGEGNAAKSGVSTTSNTLEDKRKAFRELIEGEYKDQYTEEFQQAFNRRFKESKAMEETITAQKPIIDMLMQRFNVDDLGKLQKAMEDDHDFWAGVAEEAGLTVEQYKANRKLQQENAELKAAEARRMGEQHAQMQVQLWQQQAEKVKELYPSFDFRSECNNRDFVGLLRSGVSVQQAYELMHMEEIKTATARSAAKNASEQMAASIKSKAARPAENGTSRQSAAIVRSDVHSLSRAERAEIARRAARGETIKF